MVTTEQRVLGSRGHTSWLGAEPGFELGASLLLTQNSGSPTFDVGIPLNATSVPIPSHLPRGRPVSLCHHRPGLSSLRARVCPSLVFKETDWQMCWPGQVPP